MIFALHMDYVYLTINVRANNSNLRKSYQKRNGKFWSFDKFSFYFVGPRFLIFFSRSKNSRGMQVKIEVIDLRRNDSSSTFFESESRHNCMHAAVSCNSMHRVGDTRPHNVPMFESERREIGGRENIFSIFQ